MQPVITIIVRALVLSVSLALAVANFQATAAASPPKPPGIRVAYTITLLRDGRWLVAGGYVRGNDPRNQSSSVTNEALIFVPSTGQWTNTGAMMSDRTGHAATLLLNGEVLVTGGQAITRIPSGAFFKEAATAEIYNPATGQWRFTGAMNQPRGSHTATLLPDGKVLATGGGTNSVIRLSSAELYDPKTEQWTEAAPMKFVRGLHTATLLTNGLVLVAGGWDENHNFRFDAELYDPVLDTWRITAALPFESRFFYTSTLLTSGPVLLTATSGNYAWEVTNAWEVSKILYDSASERWTAIGPRRPHFVSSENLDRTLTILPESGSQFLASQEVYFLIESADRFGATNIQLFRDGIEIAHGEESPMRYTLTNQQAGDYMFLAKAAYANGLASTSAPVAISFKASGPEVYLGLGPSEFIHEKYVNSSPAVLLATVVGVNPDSVTNLTLNGVPQPIKTGNFILSPPLNEGENMFVLEAADNRGRTARSTNSVYLNSTAPKISITQPGIHDSFDIMRLGVSGTFTAKDVKGITVNGMPAFTRSNRFEALNVFLQPGSNTLTAVVEDLAGNTASNSIVVAGPANTNAYAFDPVQLIADPPGGFAPLKVSLTVKANVPGQLNRVLYDFDGDHVTDRVTTDLQPIAVTFAEPGERFPIVTLETTAGRFSSLGQGFWFFYGPRVCVLAPPLQLSVINVADPVDIRCALTNHLYVLSGSTATLTEFDNAGKALRALKNIGGKPTGFDVDEAGNVYVALNQSNQVWKLKPTTNSFSPDTSFGNGGFIGNEDGSSGPKSNELSAPFDVAVCRDFDGEVIMVSDSGNHRVERFSRKGVIITTGFHVDRNGQFLSSLGAYGTNIGQFINPKGLSFGGSHSLLFIADSGNDRIIVAHETEALAASGKTGTSLGQFRGPVHLCASDRGLCVTDAGNDRLEIFEPVNGGGERGPLAPFIPRISLSTELGLKHPSAAAWLEDLREEKLCIADRGNNRVLLVKLPTEDPKAAWNRMKAHLLKGDLDGALSYFASTEADKYHQTYLAMGTNELVKIMTEIPPISPISIERDQAEYYFKQLVDGVLITFPIHFVKENGKWKIMEY